MIFQNLFLPCEWILIALVFVFFLIQIIYYLTFYRRLIVHKKCEEKGLISYAESEVPVSVIVYACNDADNLERFLPAILNQNYSQFEVIVVNDGSTDETKDLLTILQSRYEHLYQTYIPEEAKNHSRRKLAMTVGIKAAKYDWILTTEANCEVQSPNWISSISRNFTSETDVVLLYSTYNYPKSLKSIYRSLDNLFFSLRYLAMASLGRPYMGVRRNLSYRKELFFKNGGGFSGFLNLRDGDDDLFVNRIANNDNTRIEISPESVTKAYFQQFDKAWKNQKISYGLTSNFLKNRPSLLFGFESLTRYIFYLLLGVTIWWGVDYWKLLVVAAFLLLARTILQFLVLNKTSRLLGESVFLVFILVYDFIQPITDLKYRIAGRFSKRR